MERRDHLYEVTKGFKTAMVVTSSADGTFHARPMAVAAKA